MSAVMEFFRHLHSLISDDYKIGGKWAGCNHIASDLAEKLREEGIDPEYMQVKKRGLNRIFHPKRYHGNVPFSTHTVVYNPKDGKVYDPLLEEPVPLDEYTQEAFGEELYIEPL